MDADTKKRLEDAESLLPGIEEEDEKKSDKIQAQFLKDRGLDSETVRSYCEHGANLMIGEVARAVAEGESRIDHLLPSALAAAMDTGLVMGLLLAEQKKAKKK